MRGMYSYFNPSLAVTVAEPFHTCKLTTEFTSPALGYLNT